MLIAGDGGAQTEVVTRVTAHQPQTVSEAIQRYCFELGEYNRRNIERDILSPFGLNSKTFLSQQNEMSPEFVEKLRLDMDKSRANVQTIICGNDKRGSHVYKIDAFGRAECNDLTGFAAIGIGDKHAESQFLFAGYIPTWPLTRALLLLYAAKKRAEVAPGVGQATDMFFVTDKVLPFSQEIVDSLAITHQKMLQKQLNAIKEADDEIDAAVTAIVQKVQSETPAATPPDPPVDSPPQKKLKGKGKA